MSKLNSIKTKLQLCLMLVILIIITVFHIQTQVIVKSSIELQIQDEIAHTAKNIHSLLEPLLLTSNLTSLNKQASQIIQGQTDSFISIIDAERKPIGHWGIPFKIDKLPQNLFHTLAQKIDDVHLSIIPIRNPETKTPAGYILVGRIFQEKYSLLSSLLRFSIYSAILLFIFAFMVVRFIIKKITGPIKTLKKGLEMVSQGNMTYRITPETNDEFSFLAAKFNEMTERFQTMMAEIESTQKNLEHQVQERTADLNTANTKLKAALDELKYTQNRIILSETQKSLTSIVSGFAHEINNPLTGILGYIDLIELNDTLSLHTRRRMEGIKDQAVRIKDIIDELILLDPEIEQTKMDIDLANLLEKLIKITGQREDAAKIKFEKHFPHDELIVVGNHFSLWQIFESIVENAIEAITDRNIENGEIHVTLTTDTLSDYAVVEISDNGGGFDDIERAFNPFYTTKKRTSKKGIGLSFAFNVIQEHKGHISIRNHQQGAAVTVHLPLQNITAHIEEKNELPNDTFNSIDII